LALRGILAVLLLVFNLAGAVYAQEDGVPPAEYPALPASGSSAEDFAPPGWIVEKEVRGDLDRNGSGDMALVLRNTDPANFVKTEFDPDAPVDTNPRILAVALAGDKGYRLASATHSLIPRVTSSTQSDPLEEAGGISVDRGSLMVSIYYFSSAGGSDMGHLAFRFRHQNGAFRLIGYDRHNLHRMSGETEDVSINYLTGKKIVTKGSIENDETKSKISKAKDRPVIMLEDIGDPWDIGGE